MCVQSFSLGAAAEENEAVELEPLQVSGERLVEGSPDNGYRVRETTFGIAGLNNLPTLETPFSVKSYSFDLALNQNLDSIQDLERVDPSVVSRFSSAGYYPSLSIRGFELNNWSNYRLNGLMIVNQAQTAFENKERIEVFKGLSGLQAGFAAPGGIVNYVTKRPTEQSLNALNLAYNEFGNALVHADISRRSADGRFGVRLNLAGEALESYVDDLSGDRQFGSIATDAQITDDTLLTFDFEAQRRVQPVQPTVGLLTTGEVPRTLDPEINLGQSWDEYSTRTMTASASLTHKIDEKWTFRLEGNAMNLARDDQSTFLDAIQPNGDADLYAYIAPDERREVINTRASVNGLFETGPVAHNMTVGVSTYRQRNQWGDGFYDVIGTTNIYDPAVVPLPEIEVADSYVSGKRYEEGLFLNDVVSLNEQWDVHLGGRYAWVKYRDFNSDGSVSGVYKDNVFTPSTALVFKPRSWLATYVSYVEGLEQGGTAPVDTLNQNEQLDPLTSKQYELGTKAEFDAVTLEAALFRIERAAEYVNSENYYVQDGEQRHDGVEFSVTGRVSSQLTLIGGATFLDATLEETGDATVNGNAPTNVPDQRYTLVAEYSPSFLDKLTFVGTYAYTADRFATETNDVRIGSYSIWGLGARYGLQVYGTPLILRVNAENITDERYWTSTSFGSLVTGAPRTVWTSASINF